VFLERRRRRGRRKRRRRRMMMRRRKRRRRRGLQTMRHLPLVAISSSRSDRAPETGVSCGFERGEYRN
jgi:hypothetical protein